MYIGPFHKLLAEHFKIEATNRNLKEKKNKLNQNKLKKFESFLIKEPTDSLQIEHFKSFIFNQSTQNLTKKMYV